MRQRFSLTLFLILAIFILYGCKSSETPPQGGDFNGMRRTPGDFDPERMQEMQQLAIDACKGLEESATCSMESPRGIANGTCRVRNETLICSLSRPSMNGTWPDFPRRE